MLLQETFTTLLKDPSHWEFELLVGLIETFFLDIVFGFFIYRSFIKPYIARKRKTVIEEEHKKHGIKDSTENCVFPPKIDFPEIKGKFLDRIAWNYGIKRNKYFFGIFKESDIKLKKRTVEFYIDLHKNLGNQ
jgi:hypothetical protein